MNPPAPEKPVIVLIGNYPLDRQESMLRFRDLMQALLEARGYTVESIFPRGFVGRIVRQGGAGKWLGYVDKYILFPFALARQLGALKKKHAGRKVIVHICDHSNSVYVPVSKRFFTVLVTCHDLLAVRGALGEDTDCPATAFGRKLQAAILRGLGEATRVVCVSRATQGDLVRLGPPGVEERSDFVPLALNHAYRPLAQAEAMSVLKRAEIDLAYHGYILHVGSSALRKNRPAVARAAAEIKDEWAGLIAFAGEALSVAERAAVAETGLGPRVREIVSPDNGTLAALYSAALCLVYPSRSEGFGWPVLEAQMSGCPVVCSNRTSVPEVAGEGALAHDPDDYAGMARDIRRLLDPAFRDSEVVRGLKNAQDYTTERMLRAYEEIYREI